MRYNNAELMHDSENEMIYDNAGELILAKSQTLYVEDTVNISSFILTPSIITINSDVHVSVKAEEELTEGKM